MSDKMPPAVATPSQTVGPFFSFGLTTRPSLGSLVGQLAGAAAVRLQIRVLDGAGAPVPDALIELWLVAGRDGQGTTPPRNFGRMGTDADGCAVFETDRHAGHVNVCLFMRGLMRQIYTRIYFSDDPALASDPLLLSVPPHRRETLLAQPMPGVARGWMFEIHLQGERETVFFDV